MICHAEFHVRLAFGSAQRHGRIARRELDGVPEQVGQCLNDPIAVAPHGSSSRSQDEPYASAVGHRLNSLQCLGQEEVRLDDAANQFDLPRFDALEIENVVDQPDEPVGVGDGDLQHPLPLLGNRADQATAQEAERAANGCQRRAELVADGRHELALQAFDGFLVRYVPESQSDTRHAFLVVQDRSDDVLDGKRRAISSPEDLVTDVPENTIGQGLVDRTFIDRIGTTALRRVMRCLVGRAADQLPVLPAQHSGRSRILQTDVTRPIDRMHAVGNRVQDQLAFLGQSSVDFGDVLQRRSLPTSNSAVCSSTSLTRRRSRSLRKRRRILNAAPAASTRQRADRIRNHAV